MVNQGLVFAEEVIKGINSLEEELDRRRRLCRQRFFEDNELYRKRFWFSKKEYFDFDSENDIDEEFKRFLKFCYSRDLHQYGFGYYGGYSPNQYKDIYLKITRTYIDLRNAAKALSNKSLMLIDTDILKDFTTWSTSE